MSGSIGTLLFRQMIMTVGGLYFILFACAGLAISYGVSQFMNWDMTMIALFGFSIVIFPFAMGIYFGQMAYVSALEEIKEDSTKDRKVKEAVRFTWVMTGIVLLFVGLGFYFAFQMNNIWLTVLILMVNANIVGGLAIRNFRMFYLKDDSEDGDALS